MNDKPKRLIFIINHYSQGSDQHLFHIINLVRKLSEKGITIYLVIERCEGNPPYVNERVHVYTLKNVKGIRRAFELFVLIEKLMRKGIDKAFVRITVPTAMIVGLCGKLFGCETYYWNSGGLNERPSEPHTSKESKRTIRRIKTVGRVVDHFVTGPETMVEFYPKYCGVPKSKMLLLYNDIDTDRFSPATEDRKLMIRKELGLESDKLYVLFVHRFSPIRRSAYYIPYCLERIGIENVEFILIGDGPEKKSVVEQTNMQGLSNISFLGSLPNSTIQLYYQACDVFFNPSYCEGFPRVLIEAMACGMPIVSTDAGGSADLFGEFQKQFISDVDDRDSLAKQLEMMIENNELREQCVEENLERVKRYSTEAVSDMYINAIWQGRS